MTRSISRWVRPGLLDIPVYVPGKPTDVLQREIGDLPILRFASNENPWGPSPAAIEAVTRAATDLHRYADAGASRLRAAIAARIGVGVDQVLPTCGSNEMILLAVQAFLSPGDEVVIHHPSFLMYPIAVRGVGAVPVLVEGPDLGIDLDAMRRAVTPRTRMVFLCSPNNPTGDTVDLDAADRFIASLPDHVVVILDEAYHEYIADSGAMSGLELQRRHPLRPILVLRTFSKAHALAALRVGYGVMAADLVALFERLRQPFNVNALAQVAAVASLGDPQQVANSISRHREAAIPLADGLRRLGIGVRPSQGNFLFCRFPTDTRPLCSALEKRGIIVRPLLAFGLDERCTRITVGRPEENVVLLEELRALMGAIHGI